MSSARGAGVSDLVSLISTASQAIEKLYAVHSPSTSEVPSLQDTETHPFDVGVMQPEYRHAVRVLEAACTQLCATLARPQHVMLNRMMETFEMSCYHVAIRFKITDILGAVAPMSKGMYIDELAQRAGVDKNKLRRIMRLLVSKHVYTEVEEDVFANNRLSMTLHSSNDLSSMGLYLLEESRIAGCHLADVLADPVWGSSTDPCHTPMSRWLSESQNFKDKSLFDWYETPQGSESGARFGRGMIGWTQSTSAGAIVDEFPWGTLPVNTTVCDVGGGVGAISMEILRRNPHLRIRLQDLPERIRQASEEVWPKQYPEALIQNEGVGEARVEFKSIDFFKEPPIEGCDIYLIKNVLHDWPDSECVTILKNVKSAMMDTSRLLVYEYVITPTFVTEESSQGLEAPFPLLQNFGAGAIRQYGLDLSVMTGVNSKQRTLKEFRDLGQQAGLKFVEISSIGEMGLIEFAV